MHRCASLAPQVARRSRSLSSISSHRGPGSIATELMGRSTAVPLVLRRLNHHTRRTQSSLPAAYYRGGTSRAVFFREEDLPTDKEAWKAVFLGVIGSPDSHGRQLDGMGGGISSLSKICVVGQSQRDDADVDYTFVSLGIKDDEVDYSSNCGNMSAAVGPYAVDCGMFEPPLQGGVQEVTVRIHNTNTGKIINAVLPVVDGEAAAHGDFAIDGVSGTAAPIRLDFLRPAGSRTGKLLPSGSLVDELAGIKTTCIDVANPCCFVLAADLGVAGDLTPQQIEDHPTLLTTLDKIRRQAGVMMGLGAAPEQVPGSVPKIALVSADPAAKDRVTVRALSVGQPHKAIPVTVALAVAAAAKLPGSTVSQCVQPSSETHGLVINHASGTLKVDAKYSDNGDLELATVFRTARRLMEGRVFWK
jgi:2-methylaconitate cis-trans-isomerase PrpF